MYIVYSCVHLTDNNVSSAKLSVREPDISQVVCKYFNGVPKLWYSIQNVRPSLRLSLRT